MTVAGGNQPVQNAGVSAVRLMRSGNRREAVLAAATESSADVLVIGAHS